MIRAIVWKEWREQRAIAAAVLAFGVGALALTAQFVDPTSGGSVWSQAGARELMAQALAYLAGTVCGAMLLADEKEIGTLEFLDTLPARRRSLWVGKVVFGIGLTVLQGLALAGLALAFGCVDRRMPPETYAAVVVLIGLLAFGWGIFGGALARSTLGAVFQGSIASVVAGLALAVVFVLVFGPRAFGRSVGPVALGFYVTWLGLGLVASALVFTTVDRERRAMPLRALPGAQFVPARPRPRRDRRLPGLRALLWLSARQALYVTLAIVGAAAVGGAVMLAPDVQPLFLWPAVTLAFGVLAGITTLGEEQTRGVARFWAERRLPLGRFWLAKVGFHLALAVAAGLVLFLPLVVASPINPFRTRLLAPGNLRDELGRFLLLGLLYGFAVGHLAGMVFRKAAVAGLVASVAAVTFVGFLYPSVIGGGAAAWQVWGPALVLLLTARWLLYPWATERIAARGPVLRAVGGLAAAFAVLGAGLAYRVVEIPDVEDRLATSGFIQSLPSYEENQSGVTAKRAVSRFRLAADAATGTVTRGAGAVGAPRADGGRTPPDPMWQALEAGWRDQSRVLGPWLDRVFPDPCPWLGELDALADQPTGVFDDPRDRNVFSALDPYDDLFEMGLALRARGLQQLDAGDPGVYPRLLRGGLAAVRAARNKAGSPVAWVPLRMEEVLLGRDGLDDWIDRHRGRPEVLRPLLADLLRHEREMPVGWDDAFWAEQVILRNTMEQVGTWLAPKRLTMSRAQPPAPDPQADSEADVVTFAWNVPWERARRERILRVQTHPDRPPSDAWLSGLHLKQVWRAARSAPDEGRDLRGQGVRRFAILKVALRLYQLETGRPAADLANLVPTYLSEVPPDPYTGAPFGYRLSPGGEELTYSRPVGVLTGPREFDLPQWAAEVAAATAPHPAGALLRVAAFARFSGDAFRTRSGAGMSRGPGGAGPLRDLTVRPGDYILWSTGPDRRDDGGHHPLTSPTSSGRDEDWIAVVRTIAPQSP